MKESPQTVIEEAMKLPMASVNAEYLEYICSCTDVFLNAQKAHMCITLGGNIRDEWRI